MSKCASSVGAVIVVLAAVGLLAGCGGGDGRHGGGMMAGSGGMMGGGQSIPAGPPSGTTRTTTPGGATAGEGRALFLSSGCGSCHTLADAGTTGRSGPNLDQANPSYTRVVDQVTNGGGGMPSFTGSLTPAQIRTIARYLSGAANG